MKKQLFFLFFVIILLCYLLFAPIEAFAAASDGLMLWFHTILPSLLPFIIISNFLISTRKIPVILNHFSQFFAISMGLSVYGAYAMVLGLFCGYPMGAKVTGDLYREGLLDSEEASYLLTFTNNPSPMFISSFLLGQVLGRPELFASTLCILYLAALLTSVVFRFYFHRFRKIETKSLNLSAPADNYLTILDHAIMNGFETITKLGGYIILFSILASFMDHFMIPLPFLPDFLPGFIEMSTGVVKIMNTTYTFSIKYLVMLLCISFGGISTILQTKGMLYGTPLSLQLYIIGKIVHTIFTFIVGILFHIF